MPRGLLLFFATLLLSIRWIQAAISCVCVVFFLLAFGLWLVSLLAVCLGATCVARATAEW